MLILLRLGLSEQDCHSAYLGRALRPNATTDLAVRKQVHFPAAFMLAGEGFFMI